MGTQAAATLCIPECTIFTNLDRTTYSAHQQLHRTSHRAALMMDVAKFAVGPESYDILSQAQIANFFSSNTSCTKEECDHLAANLLGGPVSATPMQGGSSYTVERKGATKVVQFRALQLDVVKMTLAQQVHAKFVPHGDYCGSLKSLHIYLWDRVPGPAFCRVRRQMFTLDLKNDQRLETAVRDFAKFFACAWINRPPNLEPLPVALHEEYVAQLDGLLLTLPDSLHSAIDMVRQNIHLLFRPGFPIALQHGDLLENNIHVEEVSGRITGVVDWQDSFMAPFGLSLGAVEILLGVQTHTDWHFHPFHVQLRQQFWDTFYGEIGDVSELDKRSIEIARLMGLLQTHGCEQNGMSGVYLGKLIL